VLKNNKIQVKYWNLFREISSVCELEDKVEECY
jgi:hypothetical protein